MSGLMTRAAGAAVVGFTLLAGCGLADPPSDAEVPGASQDAGGARDQGGDVIVVGSAPTLRPLEFLDEENQVSGLVIDLLDAAAEDQGVELQYEQLSFDALIPALQSERIDMVTSMGDLPERRGTVTFVDYLESGAALMVAAGNPEQVRGPEELCGLAVAFTRGSSQQETTEAANEQCLQDGRPAVQFAPYPGASESILALRSGQADAAWTDRVNAVDVMDQTPDTFEVAYNDEGHGYGIGFPKEDVELRERFFDALQGLREDGTYEELVREYGLEESMLEEFTVNQGQGLEIPAGS